MSPTAEAEASSPPLPAIAGALLVLTAASSLVVYKSAGAMQSLAKAQATGALAAKARWIPIDDLPVWVRPLADAANYLSWVLIALVFGVAVGGLVRAALPERWLSRALGAKGAAGLAWGALLGAPLMLCSCCVSPVFDGSYTRTRRLGPSLALMFAAPGLNPADLTIVFLIFPRAIAFARLALSLVIVLGVSGILGRTFRQVEPAERCPVDDAQPSWRAFGRSLGAALGDTLWRSLPAILVGALLSAAIMQGLPMASLAGAGSPAVLVALAVAAVATLIALPTFGEIPIALALQLAHAPASAVVAMLVAGPIVNLPSLLVLRRTVSWKAASAVGLSVLTVAFAGGELAARWVS
ncbi:MAG: permease [Myxococcales bacterium]